MKKAGRTPQGRKALRSLVFRKAGERTRTVNLLLTRQLLCQLSYASGTYFLPFVKPFLTLPVFMHLTSVHVGPNQRTSRTSPGSNTTRNIVSVSACW